MSKDLWRWATPDGQQRDGELGELRAALAQRTIAPNALVWRTGWTDWRPAHDVPELSSPAESGGVDIPPPPAAMVAVLRNYETGSGPSLPASENVPPAPPSSVTVTSVDAARPLPTQIGGSAYGQVTGASSPTPRAGKSNRFGVPTMIGIPPPEVMGRPALPKSLPPPIPSASASARAPTPPLPPTGSVPIVIEVESNPSLLDSDELVDASRIGGAPPELPAPTDPIVQPFPFSDASLEIQQTFLPRRPGLGFILEDIAAIRQGRPPKRKLLLGALAAGALAIVIMLIAGVVSLVRGPSGSASASASASATKGTRPAASASAAPAVTAAAAQVTPPVAATSDVAVADCSAAGNSKTISSRAVGGSAIEAQALESGLAFGFAASARDAMAVAVDASSLATTKTVHAKPSASEVRRVTPAIVNGKLAALADIDAKKDALRPRRVVATKSLVDVGFADGGIAWAPHGQNGLSKLFPTQGEGRVEALRAAPLPERNGFALTFRQGNAVYVGVAKGEGSFAAEGGLSKAGGGGQVGAPTIAASGDRVLVAWAERSDASSDWKIRLARMKIGSAAEEATVFTVPSGSLGGSAMSPSVAALPGGRFLLAWAEGGVSNHQVRAVTLGEDGQPSGSPIAVSPARVNAGQPAVVVGADGRGVVAFLAAKGKAFEVHATPISCSTH